MPEKRLPPWLTGRDRAVADALIADGFSYLGVLVNDPEDLHSPETVGNWILSPACQEPVLEACDLKYGVFLTKAYADDYHDLDNAEYERVRELIAHSQLLAEV